MECEHEICTTKTGQLWEKLDLLDLRSEGEIYRHLQVESEAREPTSPSHLQAVPLHCLVHHSFAHNEVCLLPVKTRNGNERW